MLGVASGSSRCERIGDMLAANHSMCFQVCIGVTRYVSDTEEFDALVAEHSISFSDELPSVELPRKNTLEELFQPSTLINIAGRKSGFICSAEALLTVSPYAMRPSGEKPSNAPKDFAEVIAVYMPEIERTLPGLRFDDAYSADNDAMNIQFRYLVQPYRPELCPQKDLGVLQPVIVIEGHIIYPDQTAMRSLQQVLGSPNI